MDSFLELVKGFWCFLKIGEGMSGCYEEKGVDGEWRMRQISLKPSSKTIG